MIDIWQQIWYPGGLILLGLIVGGIFAWIRGKLKSSGNDLATGPVDEIWDFSERLNENVQALEREIAGHRKQYELDQAKIAALETQFAELHEFVNRGIKRMSTRAQRAEMLTAFNEDLEELEQQTQPQQQQLNFSNHKPRLVRPNK